MRNSRLKIVDLISFAKAIVDANQRFQGQVWWRGHGQIEWELKPSVYREDGGYEYEQNVISRFRQRAHSRAGNLPDTTDWFGWLFLMQHYRAHTRMLDWTESPAIACHFAVRNEERDEMDGCLFALSPYLLNLDQTDIDGMIYPEMEEAKVGIRKAFDPASADIERVIAIQPPEIFPRMMIQISVFTIHGSGLVLDKLSGSDNFLIQYRIPATNKKDLREALKYLGVRESILFPDLDHLGAETTTLKFKPPRGGPRTNSGESTDILIDWKPSPGRST